jgi:hypothetical protein
VLTNAHNKDRVISLTCLRAALVQQTRQRPANFKHQLRVRAMKVAHLCTFGRNENNQGQNKIETRDAPIQLLGCHEDEQTDLFAVWCGPVGVFSEISLRMQQREN